MPVTNMTTLLAWARDFVERGGDLDEVRKVRDVSRNLGFPDYTTTLAACGGCGASIVKDLARTPTRVDRDRLACERCDECRECCGCEHCERCGKPVESTCSCCNKCDGCCPCATCESCSEPVEHVCSSCDRCEGCCSCYHCAGCDDDAPSDEWCSSCDRCDDCCSCNSGDKVERFTCDLKFHPAKLTERKFNPSPRFISVEIEVAEVNRDEGVSSTVREWRGSIVEDGSLPSSGFEINTAPASGDVYVRQINEVCRALAASGAQITRACGLHVHVDARDFDFYAVRRLVRLYAKIEPALFKMVPPSRRTSRYCMPCGGDYAAAVEKGRVAYKDVKKSVHVAVYKQEPDRGIKAKKANKYDGARYAALNLHSWFVRGTIECRMFSGSVSAEKIIAWGMLWARILDYVASRTDEEVAADVDTRNMPKTLLKKVAGLPHLVRFIDERTKLHAHGDADDGE